MASVAFTSIVATLLVVAAQIHLGLAFQSTVPAFLWSSHRNGGRSEAAQQKLHIESLRTEPRELMSINETKMKEMVDYRILSPRELAKSVMTRGGWSDYLCARDEDQKSQNFAFLFVGSELQSQDVSRSTKTDPALVGLLKDSFSNSSFSVAFPYVTSQEDETTLESSLISEFTSTCQQKSRISNIALVGSCSVEGETFDKLEDIDSFHGYLQSRIEKNLDGQTDLIVICHGGSRSLEDSDQSHSESGVLSQLLNSMERLGAEYTFLYVSDPLKSNYHLSRQGLERFLAEGTTGNGSVSSTGCDGVCQIKSSLLEGLLVGIVLLLILLSGLCCMMGIDTPSRFEAPQDS